MTILATYNLEVDWENTGVFGDLPAAQFTRANSEELTIVDNELISTGDISYTIAGWVNFDTKPTGSRAGLYQKFDDVAGGELALLYDDLASLDRFRFFVGSGAASSAVTANNFGGLTTGVWLFILVSHTASSSTLSIRINNGTADTFVTALTPQNGTSPLRFGNDKTGAGRFLDGKMACWGFWKRILTANEQTFLYNSGTPIPYNLLGLSTDNGSNLKTNLISYWELFEASGIRYDRHLNSKNNLTDVNTVTQATSAFTSGINDDITTDVRKMGWKMGRDFASDVTGKSVAGRFEAVLDNYSAKYSPFNPSSPIFEQAIPGRMVRVRMTVSSTTKTMWQGFLKVIAPLPATTPQRWTATLQAVGPLEFISEERTSVQMQTNILTGAAADVVLDDSKWPEKDRVIADGQTLMTRYFTGGSVKSLFALRDIETTEGGFVRESRDGKIVVEDAHTRIKPPHDTSQASYTNVTAGALRYSEGSHENPLKEIFNRVTAEVQLYTVGALAVLWTYAETGVNSPALGPGSSKIIFASYPNPASAINAVAVDAWTDPVATTDYTANISSDGSGADKTASVSITVSKLDTAMKLTITNTDPSETIFLTFLQARGTPITADDPIKVQKDDEDSRSKYGRREYPIKAKFLPNTARAERYAEWILSLRKDPAPVASLRFYGNVSTAALVNVRDREISDRISLVANSDIGLFIDEDCFIEQMVHTVASNGVHWMEMKVSPVGPRGGDRWILSTSQLTTSTKLAF